MNILILDAYSSAHIGNGVLYQSSVYYLKKMFPESIINVLCFRRESIEKIKLEEVNRHASVCIKEPPVGESAIKKLNWMVSSYSFLMMQLINQKTLKIKPSKLAINSEVKEALDLLEEADITVSITGEQINDAFRKTLPQFMMLHKLAIEMGKKMIYFPQSIGPLNKEWTQRMVKKVLGKSFLTIARDEYSVNELNKLKIDKSKFIFTPDIGVMQPYSNREEAIELLKSMGIEKHKDRIIGLTLSKIHFVEDGIDIKNYLEILLNALNKKFDNNKVQFLLMPANYNLDGSTSTDYKTSLEFKAKLEERFQVDILPLKNYSPYDFKGIQGYMDFIISTRMHASILSTMAETPTITINTQRKLRGYMKNIDMEKLSIDLKDLDEEVLIEKIDIILEDYKNIKNILSMSKSRVIKKLDTIEEVINKRV